jgi:lysine-N-methylase
MTSTPRYFTELMLTPKYVTDFQCIGADCPDTCCAGWSITIDKDSFQSYRRVVHPVLKPLLKAHLVHVDKTSHDKHGAINLRKSDSHCVLHSSEGLCHLQRELGEDALSDTCYVYPRFVAKFGDRFQQCLTLSCPEAARLALAQDEAFDIKSSVFTSRLATTTVIGPVRGFTIKSMDEVHIFLIQLFQTHALSNTERLVTVGWLCQRLDELVYAGEQATVDTLITQMRELVEAGTIHSIVGQLHPQQDASVTLFSILFGNKSTLGKSDLQKEILHRVKAGLEIDRDLKLTRISENYACGNRLLNESESSNLYNNLMTRFLLNDLFRETFPWKQHTAMKHYQDLLTRYGILRLMLSGVAANLGKAPDQTTMVHTISVFCRLYQHDSTLSSQTDALLAQSEWKSLERLYSLLN